MVSPSKQGTSGSPLLEEQLQPKQGTTQAPELHRFSTNTQLPSPLERPQAAPTTC